MDRINVTKTFLPPIEEYQAYLKQMWDDVWITNQGPLLQQFEKQATEHLDVQNFHFVSNGTIALQVALRALDITEGEVITTPFSYVATTSAILWERCTPVFVDIDPETLCIDADKIEAAITGKTKAIMPVHVFGYPCDVDKIDAIAKKHGLKVIYDAAHAFDVSYKGKSLFEHGDISIGSFHATKVFHTIEGGCLVVKDKAISDKVELIKRFGHNGDTHLRLGINAKASEVHAAMGLCNLKYVEQNILARKQKVELYDSLLSDKVRRIAPHTGATRNYGYYPIIFKTEAELLKVLELLSKQNVFPRRYFFPSLNQLPYISDAQSCPISEDITSRILCLPLYGDLQDDVIKTVCEVINS